MRTHVEVKKLSTRSEAVVKGYDLVIIKCKPAVAALMRHAAAERDEETAIWESHRSELKVKTAMLDWCGGASPRSTREVKGHFQAGCLRQIELFLKQQHLHSSHDGYHHRRCPPTHCF